MIFGQKYAHTTILQGVRQEYWDKPRSLSPSTTTVPDAKVELIVSGQTPRTNLRDFGGSVAVSRMEMAAESLRLGLLRSGILLPLQLRAPLEVR